ncbi:phage portal protein [Malikia granosa]|uniref:Phage portal protein n=1 Tax=Malikia granosa TaxID=263067 RepID=A0A2S9K342_9BURK|nr:phage portal protein [Malikia granosa]PRD64807.1 phage portal protein [Malikia granosa]
MAAPKLTLVDRMVAWINPVAGIQRAHARTVLSYYEAAKPDRTRKGRRAVGTANHEVLQAGATLRQTARHLEQNYDLALGVLNTLVSNVVGPTGIGIEPQPRRADGSIDDDLARQILGLWKDWCTNPEVTRQHDWASAQRLLCRSFFRDGEVFAQVLSGQTPGLNHGTRVPLSIEMIEADLVPMDYNGSAPATVVQGIEVNAWGAPTGYHVLKVSPLDSGTTSMVVGGQTKRIGAANMLHLKNVHRIRQLRGVSVFASVLNRFDDLKDYEESERIAAKIAASMAAFIRKGTPDLYQPDDAQEQRYLKFRPGMIFDDLRPGEEIGTIDTNRPNPNLETYRSGQLKAIAAGAGPTFSSIARTYDGTYSAQRQELVEGYAIYATLANEFIGRIVRPIYEQFVAVAAISGLLKVPAGIKPESLNDATYMPPAMPWIDPKKEAEAWGLLEDRCYVSGPEVIRRRGGNPIDTLEQQSRWMREKQAQGLPANAGQQAGGAQPVPPDPADPDQQD